MKTIREILAKLTPARRKGVAQWLQLVLVLTVGLAAGAASAQPANDDFTNAAVISGYSGTVSDVNIGASMELPCELTTIAFDDHASLTNSVWYVWTAPASGTATFNTVGSGFDTVLAVFTDNNPTNLCAAREIAADHYYTNSAGILQTNSLVSFQAVAGKNYYVSVNGNAALDPTNDSGFYMLNWSLATIPAGMFRFTTGDSQQLGTPEFYESANEAAGTIDTSVSPSWPGGRITVTRLGSASGRALVDYVITSATYTNVFTTNSFGTNFITTFIDTNVPPNISTTNVVESIIIYSNAFEYLGTLGYEFYSEVGSLTNTVTFEYLKIGTAVNVTNAPLTQVVLNPLPTPPPPLTNYTIITTNLVAASGATNLTITTLFSYTNTSLIVEQPFRNRTTYTNGSVIYTNFANYSTYLDTNLTTVFYGTNITTLYSVLGGANFLTNYYYTNIVSSNYTLYAEDIYTNADAVPPAITNYSTNYPVYFGSFSSTWSASNNVGTILMINGGTGPAGFSNVPPFGVIGSINVISNSDGSTNMYVTNSFVNPQVVAQVLVPSAPGAAGSGTLTFDDYQMSADITVVPRNYGVFIDGLPGPNPINITLLNPRLDPLESSDLIPPVIDPANGVATVDIFNNNFVEGATTNGGLAAVLNFEREHFRVNENVVTSNAVVYVTRVGNGVACTVDYQIDFLPPSSPNQNHFFSLQADSDYATPNVDFVSVTGTLSFPQAPNPGWNQQPITIPINNDGDVEFNEDMILQLFNAQPVPAAPPTSPYAAIGLVGTASLTIVPSVEPAGAVDRNWNTDNSPNSNPPYIPYPGVSGGVSDTFNGNGGTVYALAEQPDGNALIAGSFISFDSHAYNRIVRVMTNGYQDPTFLVSPNSGANDFIAAMQLQPDGRIIIGGNFTSFNGYNRYHIARLNPDGSVDTTFNPGLGVGGTSPMVWSIALQPNGQMVIAGNFTSYNGTNVNSVARLNPDGSLDTSFNPGAGPDGVVNAVVVDSQGRVVIGGEFDSVSGTAAGGVTRLNVDGSVDQTFALGIGTFNPDTGFTDPVNALALQPDGKILVGGGFSFVDLVSYNGIVRLNTDGTIDLNFTTGTGTFNPVTGISDSVNAITLQPGGNILIGGDFTTFNQTRRVGVARLFSYGSVDTSFMDTAYNQFAGVINHYHNPNANNGALYPQGNERNYVNAIALESGGNVIVGGGFLRVGGGSNRADIHPRSNVARLIGGATPGPGNIQFSYNNYSVDKDGGSLYVSLVRANGNLGIISATFGTNMAAPGPGIASVTNFSIRAGTIALPTWDEAYSANSWQVNPCLTGPNYAETPVTDRAADVYLNIINNNNSYGNVNANLLLSTPVGTNFFLGGEVIPVGAALGPQAASPLTIIDDTVHPGTLSFSQPQYTVLENGGTATITVVRASGTDGQVTINYTTANGAPPNGATNAIDYTATSGTLLFKAGDTSKTFTIPIIPGSLIRPDRTLNLRLFNPTGGAGLGLTNATLTIINSVYTPGHISFVSTSYGTNYYGTNENAGYALITLAREGGGSGTISVQVQTSDGTAVNGVNYIGSTNTLTWNNNVVNNQTIAIPVIDDHVVTSNLTVNLRLANPLYNSSYSASVLGLSQYTNATLFITNVDSTGTVQFSSPTYSVKKYGGYALIPVTRVGGSIGTVDVTFMTMDLTASNGVNYTAVSTNLHFAAGEVSKFVAVPVIEDNQIDGPLALGLLLTNANPATAMGTISNAVLNIIDSDQVNETPGSPDPTYGAFGFNDSVFAMALQSDNKLVVGGDFTEANGVPRQRIARLNAEGSLDTSFLLPSFTLGASGSVRALAVQQDGRILVGGLFTNFNSVSLNYVARLNTDGTLDSLFNPGSGADNPVYAMAETFVNGQSKILLGGSFATVDGVTYDGIARLNTDGTPDSTFNTGLGANATVYTLALQSDGKVIIGGDFTAVNGNTNFNHIARLNTDGSLDYTFNPGTGASDSVRAIAVQLDGRILVGGIFTSFNGNTNFNHIGRLNADGSTDTNFIPGLGANDAVFSIALQSDSRIVLGGEFTTCSGVTRNRITRLLPNGTVDPTINFGYGANNFVAAVVIQDDTIAGYPTNILDEKIIIGGGFTQYDNQPYPNLVRIYGGSIGGSGAFQFTSANYSVDENGTNAIVTVLRTGGTSGTNTDDSGDVFVPFVTSNGTALAYTNYIPVITNLDFPEGEVIRNISIPVMNDGLIHPNLTVNLAVNPAPPLQYGDQPTATLTIINDNSSISFASANYQVAKNIVSGTAAINISRQGSASGTTTVNFATVGGTATSPTDYTPVNETVTFNPGVSNVTVYIPINNNGIAEGNRTVGMQLANASGSVLLSPTNATLTIIDTVNAPGELSFASPTYTVTEGGGVGYTNVYVTVQRTFGSAGTVSVGFQTQDGTAAAGAKYVPTNGVLVFADGEVSKTFPVFVANTTTAEGPETFSIYLYNPTGGATLVTPTNTVVTILNTNIGIAFVSAVNSYTEPAGAAPSTLSLQVIRYNSTNGTTTVNYSTTNGTAMAGTDFVGVNNATLTFNPGESVKTIAITTLHNPLVTGDLSFTVGLANPSGSAQLTPPTFTTVIDHDADAGISFLTNATSVFRNAGVVVIPVQCSNTNAEPVSVNYSTGGGTAVAGVDYVAANGTLSFTNGVATNFVAVKILLNNSVQTNRSFNVTLSAPTPPGVLVPPSTEMVTIIGTNTPPGLSFSSPIIISGIWGTTNANNTLGGPEAGDPNIANYPANAPVWFEWTAPPGLNGEVTLDTIGSVGSSGQKLDTVLGVFTGSSLGNLTQLAANDDIFPTYETSNVLEYAQNIFNTNGVVTTNGFTIINGNLIPILQTNNNGEYQAVQNGLEPYGGPSEVKFNAVGGTTYFIAVDAKSQLNLLLNAQIIQLLKALGLTNNAFLSTFEGRGTVQLDWAYHPAGVFRFASDEVDETGITDTNGNPMLLLKCAESEGGGLSLVNNGNVNSLHRVKWNGSTPQLDTTFKAYYFYDVQGLLVTVTRVAGSSGRVTVDYSTEDGDTNIISNGDNPAIGGQDYTPVSGTLIFDDFEMSKTIVIPIVDDGGIARPNRDFEVVLSNPQRDPAESGNVSAPRVDSIFGKVLCRILDCDIDPKGPTIEQVLVTNITVLSTNIVTNTFIADQFGQLFTPTNGIFNFSKEDYRIPRDVQEYWTGTPVTIFVNRSGTNRASVTIHYRLDNFFLDQVTTDDRNNEFPLQPGSDYAVPTPAETSGVHGTNSDFVGANGESGTLTFPGGKGPDAFNSQPIYLNIQNNHIPGFNKDIHLTLYEDDSNNNPQQDGMVAEANLTILFDDNAPPAGSVDELYNPDFATDLAFKTKVASLNSSVLHPGTDPLGDVYSVALNYQGSRPITGETNNPAIIGGAFATYTDSTNTYTVNGVARLLTDGSLDPNFNLVSGHIGSGVNVFPGDEFIRSVAITVDNKILVGGDFTSFDNNRRNGVARLNSDGTLDATFNPGAGANGEVWSVLAQADGKVLIGGEFTAYNGAVANHVARLNADGSLDSTFNASNLISGPVYAMALSPQSPLNFNRVSDGSANEDDQTISLGLQTSGVLNLTFNMAANTNLIQVFYGGNNNLTPGTGVLLFQSTASSVVSIPFGPVGGFSTNVITVVVNPGGSIYAPPLSWNYNVNMAGQTNLIIGGDFKVTGQSIGNIARLNTDGSFDATFNPGTGPNGPVYSLGWQPDGKVIVGGSFASLTGVSLNNLARLNSDGSIDGSFFNGTGADNPVYSITLQPVSGLIYVGGPFTLMNGTHRLGFARLYSDGTVDTTFMDTAYNQFAGLPRILFADAPNGVYSCALQDDGSPIVGGSFQEVGGGQVDLNARRVVEAERGLTPSTTNVDLLVSEGDTELEPKSRDGVRNRSNLARLMAGSTTGPGNIGLVNASYAVNRTQSSEPVLLARQNGSIGYASANFEILPGLATSGVDYSYGGPAPFYPISWDISGPTRMRSDGQFGANGLMQDRYGEFFTYGINGPASININLMGDTAVVGNLSAQFTMANPSQADAFYLGGQDIPLGVGLGISQAPLTLVDNTHEDGVFSYASPTYVATNSPFPVTISRTNGTFGTVQVYYQTVTNGSTAIQDVDYRATNGFVTFNQGDVSHPFQLTVLNSSSVSAQEKDLNVQLYNLQDLSGGRAQLGLTNAVVRFINPNYPGYLNFNTNAYYGSLSAGSVTFAVTRTVGAKGTATVQYGTANATAMNNVDYIGSTNTLTWNSGDVSPRFVTIPLINHSALGQNKLFTASLFNPTLNGTNTPGLLGAVTSAVFVIVNDNSYGAFQFSSPSYQYNDNGGWATISVTRGGSALGTASVTYATADGTAVAGANYVETNNTLTFLPGQLVKSFNVKLLDDGKTNDPAPANFYFNVTLSSPTAGASLGSPTTSLVHLVHGEQYNQPPGSVDNSFTADVNASVLGLAIQSTGKIVAGGSFTIADGTSINRIARFNTDGTLDAGFASGLAGADNTVNAVVSQTDDRVVMGGAFANFNSVSRPGLVRLMTDGSVDTSFNPGAGADNAVFAVAEAFVNGSRDLYIGGAFNTFNTVPSPGIVRVNNSGAVDSSFSVGGGALGTVYAVAVYPTNSVYNAGKVLVGGTFTNFNGSLAGNLVRLNPDGSLDTNFDQNVSLNAAVRALAIQLDGSVLVGGDFTNDSATVANHLLRLNADGTVDGAFNAASAPGINGTVDAISIQQDNHIVVVGQFSSANGVSRQGITRLLPTGAVDPAINFGTGANGAINTVLIQPADGNLVIGGAFTQFNGQSCDHIARLFGNSMTGSGAFQFTSPNYSIDENGGFATITIERTGGTSGTNADGSGDVFVAFNTMDGSAVAGTNYTYTTNYIDFPAGEVFKTVYVPVRDDGVITPNLTVNLFLSNPTPGTSLGDQATALLTIINDDNVVEFLSSSYSVPKNTANGLAEIQVVRLGSTSGSCTVNFATTTNGTAVVGTDYFPTNTLITFNPGDMTNTVQVVITNNGIAEGNRTVTMILSNAVTTALASPSNAVLTIQDTVVAPGNLFFVATNFAGNSSSGLAYLTVGRTNGSSGSVSATYYTVTLGTGNGFAQPGKDYVAVTNSVTFNDGDTLKTVTVPLVNNPLPEIPGVFGVNLINPIGGAGLIAPTNATVTIFNTNAVLAFALATNTVAEEQGSASIVVQRFNNTGIASSVSYATVNGTAVAGVNFSNTVGTLNFGVGEVFKAISIPLINQSNITSLAFGVSLYNPFQAQVAQPSNTVVVLEGSAAGLSFSTNATSVLKNAGSVLITVVCSNTRVEPVATNTPLEVSFTTVDGTGRAGFDYNATNGVLVFANGVGTNTFVVPILNDPVFSSNLTFSVVLTNATQPGRISPYGTETVTIGESSPGFQFSQSSYSVYKNAGFATISVVRTGFTDTVASVDFLVTNGTAIGGQNFYPTNGTLVFTNGVTTQSFNVALIANTQVQPNLFALMELMNPTNAVIANPAVATLTIIENGGSYVIPAGAQLVGSSSPQNLAYNVVGSNDTVQVLFAFRDAAGLNVTNLIAYLLATNGVTSPSPASQTYGPLTAYGHSVSRAFSFTAHGTNTLTISPTFQLYDNGKFIGPATFVFTVGAWTTTFANTNMIIINDHSAASPYPSIIDVTNLGNTLVKATVTITNLSHQNLSDLDALVVSPSTNTLIMAHAGAGFKAAHLTLTFDDAATNSLPQNGTVLSGTNKPTQFYPVPNFP